MLGEGSCSGNQAGLAWGGEGPAAGWAKCGARGLGEGAQTRLAEVAIIAGRFVLFAHDPICYGWAASLTAAILGLRDDKRKSCRKGKLSNFRQV